jgi:hypothetical protein
VLALWGVIWYIKGSPYALPREIQLCADGVTLTIPLGCAYLRRVNESCTTHRHLAMRGPGENECQQVCAVAF